MIKNKNKQKNNLLNKGANLINNVDQVKGLLSAFKDEGAGSIKKIKTGYGKIAQGELAFKKLKNGDWSLLDNQLLSLKNNPFMEMGLKAFMKVKSTGNKWDFDLLWELNNEKFLGKKGLSDLLDQYGAQLGLGGLKNWKGKQINYGFSGGGVWMELKDFPLDFYGQKGAKASFLWKNGRFSLKIKGAFKKDSFPKIDYQVNYQKGQLKGWAKGQYKNDYLQSKLKLMLNNGVWSVDGNVKVKHDFFKGNIQYYIASEGEKKSNSEKEQYDFLKEMQLTAKGKVQFHLNPYLRGDCNLLLDKEGYIAVDGALHFPKQIDLIAAKNEEKELFNQKIKAGYGVPLLAQIYLFAGISAYMKYGWEAVRLENIIAEGQWSNHPSKSSFFNIGAQLNLGAYAGLGMQIEGGAGLTVLGHDVEASLGLHAEALLKAQAILGTKIQLGEEQQKLSSFFKAGAQLSLLLYGDFGFKIDAPFWSPVPDKEWSEPFGNKEIPMGFDLFEMGGKLDVDFEKGINSSEILMDEVEIDGAQLVESIISKKTQGAQKRPKAPMELQDQAFKSGKKKGKNTPQEKPKESQNLIAASKSLTDISEKYKDNPVNTEDLNKELKQIKSEHKIKQIKKETKGQEVNIVLIDEQMENQPVTVKIEEKSSKEEGKQTIERGAFTFSMEGSADEKSIYFSRKAHWPGGVSGITIGRGYDLAHRGKKDMILKELASVGLNNSVFKEAIALKGDEAKVFLKQNQNRFPIISIAQENELFKISYNAIEQDTIRLMNKEDVKAKYGAIDWNQLNPAIKEILVDLRFRGDYSPKTRSFLQSVIVANDLQAFYKIMKDRSKWSSVPTHRFKSRHEFLANYLSGEMNGTSYAESDHKPSKSESQITKNTQKKPSGGKEKYQVNATQLNVRDAPSINGSIVAQLLQGALVEVLDSEGDWRSIGPNKWVHGAYLKALTKENTTQYSAWVQTEVLNVRKGPGIQFEKRQQLKKGEEVSVFTSESTWLKIGQEEWVHEDFVAKTKPAVQQKPKQTKTSNTNGSIGVIDISKVGKNEHRKVTATYEELMRKERLDPSEIHKVREHIKTLSPTAQADAYEKLQEKVHYKNQRNNKAKATAADLKRNSWMAKYGITSAGDLMCNLTAMAMALEYLGIENPDPRHQFEDFLEYYRQQKYGTQDRRNPNTWITIASDFHVEAKSMPLNTSKKEQLEKLQSYLSGGAALLISMFSSASGKGHIVRLQKVEKEGLRVDDPYGKIADLGVRERGASGYKHKGIDGRNSKTLEEGLGEDQLWTWDNLANTVVKYAVYFKG